MLFICKTIINAVETPQPIVFKIMAHFGHSLMYFMCRQKACTDPLTVSFSRTWRGLWNCYCFCEFISKWINLCYNPFQANVEIFQTARVCQPCGQSTHHYPAQKVCSLLLTNTAKLPIFKKFRDLGHFDAQRRKSCYAEKITTSSAG